MDYRARVDGLLHALLIDRVALSPECRVFQSEGEAVCTGSNGMDFLVVM